MERIKKRRKEIFTDLKTRLKDKTIRHNSIDESITFSTKGIKEALNQPHESLKHKNEIVGKIDEVLPKSEYRGITYHKGRKSHIFSTLINDKESYIIVNEYKGRGLVFYSITDSDKVLE